MNFEPKLGHKIILGASGLTVALFLFGFIYVYYNDSRTILPAKQAATQITAQSLPKPVKPGANAKEGVSINTISSPVALGAQASVSVQTDAGSNCTVLVSYGSTKANSPSLGPQTANVYGGATWNWIIPKNAPIGSVPIKITCTYNKQTAVVDEPLLITQN